MPEKGNKTTRLSYRNSLALCKIYPPLVEELYGLFATKRWIVTAGLRSVEEQERLYAIGRTSEPGKPILTKARGGESLHNFGLAVDLAPLGIDGVSVNWQDIGAWIELREFCAARQMRLQWGGNWSIQDKPHVEVASSIIQDSWRSRAAMLDCLTKHGLARLWEAIDQKWP
ncbi:MAG: M15 family metallopeptidase [Terriglobia bacterium]